MVFVTPLTTTAIILSLEAGEIQERVFQAGLFQSELNVCILKLLEQLRELIDCLEWQDVDVPGLGGVLVVFVGTLNDFEYQLLTLSCV